MDDETQLVFVAAWLQILSATSVLPLPPTSKFAYNRMNGKVKSRFCPSEKQIHLSCTYTMALTNSRLSGTNAAARPRASIYH